MEVLLNARVGSTRVRANRYEQQLRWWLVGECRVSYVWIGDYALEAGVGMLLLVMRCPYCPLEKTNQDLAFKPWNFAACRGWLRRGATRTNRDEQPCRCGDSTEGLLVEVQIAEHVQFTTVRGFLPISPTPAQFLVQAEYEVDDLHTYCPSDEKSKTLRT